MRQRVAVARTFAIEPNILLMDEPFGALDSQTRLLLQELFLEVWEKNKRTVLFVTHDLHEAIFLSDVVIVSTNRPGRVKSMVPIDAAAAAPAARRAGGRAGIPRHLFAHLGRPQGRGAEVRLSLVIARRAQHAEAISRRGGLLRFARNDACGGKEAA